MTEPRTEAGRALYQKPYVFDTFLSDILAIEDQAAQAARAEIAEKVRGLRPYEKFVDRDAVLHLIEGGPDDR